MGLKEIRKDIYDVDAWIDEGIGAVGTPKRGKIVPSVAMLYKIAAAMGLCVELRPI